MGEGGEGGRGGGGGGGEGGHSPTVCGGETHQQCVCVCVSSH